MQKDVVDKVLKRWRDERPDLDPRPIAVVGRILLLAGAFERRANNALAAHDLALSGFDVLAALRRAGSPYSLTPTELLRCVLLTSGAMTNRIDRLEKKGLVVRTPDSNDRRSMRVGLTPKGLRLVDEAVPVRFQEAKVALESLTRQEEEVLGSLLRKLLLAVGDETFTRDSIPAMKSR